MPNSLKKPLIDRISIVLRSADGQTLEQITPFVQQGAHVSIGRGLAVIAACSGGDAIKELHQAESQVVLAESAMRRGILLGEDSLAATQSMHIDDRVKMVCAEPAYLTIVFKLSSLNDAQPLIAQLPYGQKALGTEAIVHGLTVGNLMEVEPCAD